MKLYKNGDSYYKMVEPVGYHNSERFRHYALWRPVEKFLWFWISNGKQEFMLDMAGFVEVDGKGNPK